MTVSPHFSSDPQAPSSSAEDFSSAADVVWSHVTAVKHLRRRNSRIDVFDAAKLERSIRAAFTVSNLPTDEQEAAAKKITEQVVATLTNRFNGHTIPSVQDVRDAIATALLAANFGTVAEEYLSYRLTRPSIKPAVSASDFLGSTTVPATSAPVASIPAPRRHRLNEERKAITHKFQVGNYEAYLTVGLYDDTRQPGEIFVTMSKDGTVMSGMMDAFATSISIGLQYGVPLKVFVKKFANMRFEPSGATQNPNIPNATSIIDYIFRWLAMKFLTPEERQAAAIEASSPSLESRGSAFDRQPRLVDSGQFGGLPLD